MKHERLARSTRLLVSTLILAAENVAGCALDLAQVTWIPPATFQVLATYSCPTTLCIERWIEVEGRRLRHVQVCEAVSASDTLKPKGAQP